MGSGKTTVLCRIAMGLAFAHPGIRLLVGRFNFTELRDTTLNTFFDYVRLIEDTTRDRLPPNRRAEFQGVGAFRKDTGDYQVFNGSTLLFRHLEDGHRRFKSLEIGGFLIDEASEVEAEQEKPPTVLMLLARLRQKGMPLVGGIVSNPTGFDHWLYRWYGEGVGGRMGIGKMGWPVFRTNMLENQDNLPEGYIEGLRQKYPESWVRRYVEGEWGGIDEGAPIFPMFSIATHVRPVEWMRRVPVHIGIDLGYKAPGVVWAQIEPGTHRLHVLRSWDPKNLDVYKLAQGIRQRNEGWFPNARFHVYCGHDGNAHKDTNPRSSVEILAEYGLTPRVRYTATERGLTSIRSLLGVRDDGEPGLYVAPHNPVLIEGMNGGYRYDPKKEDEPLKTDRYDPLVDALRYIVVNQFTTAGHTPSYTAVPAFRGLARNR